MIEPEIHHHFIQLPFAVSRAEDLLLRQIAKHATLRLHQLHLFGRPHIALVRDLFGGLSGCLLLHAAPLHQRRAEIVLGKLATALRKRVETGKPGRHGGIGEGLRPELLVDVLVQTHSPKALNVARRRSEAEPVQHVNDRLVIRMGWDAQRQRGGKNTGQLDQGDDGRNSNKFANLHDGSSVRAAVSLQV